MSTSSRAPLWLRALLPCWMLVGALACAVQRGAAVTPQAGYAAATVDELRATPPGDDALTAARLAEQRGADEVAVGHAQVALHAAQMDAAIAELREGPARQRVANRRWRERARIARRLTARAHDPQAQVDAIAASPKPGRHARALRRAVHEASHQPWGLERLGALVDRTPVRVALLRHGIVGDAHTWLVAFDRLPRRAQRDPLLLAIALRDASLLERPRAELVRRARALLEHDRWHVPARLVVAADRELAAGRLRDDPWLWTDLVSAAGTSVLVRMEQRLARHEHPLWRLALAEELLQAGLVGDAAQVLHRAKQPSYERDAAGLVDALIQLRLGRASAFESWRAQHDEPSWSLDEQVATLDRAAHGDVGVRKVAAAARRRLVATRDRPRIVADETLMRTALDERARPRLRRRARAELAARPSSARIAAQCARAQKDADACAELMELPLWQPSGARIEALPFLAAADALDASAWTFEHAPALHWLERSRENVGVAAVYAAIAAAEHRGDRAGSVAVLERSGKLLPIHVRVGLALAFEDPQPLDPDIAQMLLPSFDELASGSWEFELEPRTGSHGALVAALVTVGEDPCAAMPSLRDFSMQRRGETSAWLAAYGAWAAIECGDDGAAKWFIARVQAGAPQAAIVYALRGEQLARRGQQGQAARWFAAALARDPELLIAFAGLERWAERSGDDHGLRRLIAAAPEWWMADHSALVRASARGRLTARRDIAAARATVDDADLTHAERLARLDPQLADTVLQAFVDQLGRAVDLQRSRGLATRMLALLEQLARDRDADLSHWQYTAEGLAFLLRREPLVLDPAAPRLPGDPVTMLLRARSKGAIDDAQAHEIHRARFTWGGPRPSADAVLAGIVDAPATAELRAFACDELVRAERWPEAVKTCVAAWRTSHGVVLAGLAARAALGDPAAIDEAALAELFASEPPHFPASDEEAGGWWAARARHHELHGHPEAAAAAWLEAIARGTAAEDDDWAQLPNRGISIRHDELTRPIDSSVLARQAFLALLGGDVEVARGYARAAVASSGAAPRLQRHRAAHRLAFVELVAADLAARELDRAAIIEATTLLFTDVEPARYEAFGAAHPRSRVARVIEAERALEGGDVARARSAIAALDELGAPDVLAVATAIRTAVVAGEQSRARALFVAARRREPHPLLDTLVVPEAVRGRDPEVPPWLRDRAVVHARMAGARDDERPRYTRRSLLEQELEVWVPESWSSEPDAPLSFTAPEGWSVALESRPRASRCSGPECAQLLRRELESTGATVLWSAPIDTGAGPATELAAAFGDDAMLITVVPRGGRELRLVARAPLEYAEHMLPALRVARDSFHPLDGVIGGFRAESLRRSAAPLGDDVRLHIREALARGPTKACPIAAVLEGLDPGARDSALVDAWLVTHTPQQRRALTACAEAKAAAAGGIAVLALLDDDTRVHAWGRAAVQAHPERARTSARTLFTSALEPALADPDHLRRPDLPPRGVLELVAALPSPHAEAMVAELVAAPADRERALGFAAAGIRRDLLPRARALELVRTGDVRSAALAIDYLLEELVPGELAPIRARVDALRPTTQPERELLVQACAALADAGRPEDAPRLRRAAARVMVPGGAPEEVQLTRRVLDAIVDVHRQGRERREQIPTPEHVRAADTIDEVGLAELLPGRDWFYAKVSNPRLVWSSARAALARLSGGSAADRQMVGEVVKNLLARAGTGLFADDAGLDMSRGIECATNPKISSGEVCTAWVTDRDRVLTLLAERDFGEDDGLVLPLHVAQGFAKAPRFLSALPLFLPGMLVTEDPGPEQPIVFEERVRTEVLLGPHRLHSSLIVRGHPGEIDIDEEHYLFVGDRMFAFTTRRLANAVLGASTKVLAADPEFVALAQRLHGDAGIVGAGLGAAAEGNASTIELAVDERGLRFRQLVRNEDPIGDAAQVIAQLPPDAAATWSVGSGAPREELEATTKPGDDEGTAPPAELSRTRGSIAFGWYPRAGEGLWHDWAIALEPTEQDRRALARAKLIPRSPGLVRAGVHAAVRDRLLVYASSRVLLDRALATQAGGARARVYARGSFRGGPSSTAVNAARSGELAFRRFLSLGLGVVESAEYQADDEAGAGLLAIAGRITLALADDDRPSDVVDAWLAAHDDSNSILLPRPLQPRDLAKKLTYVLEVVEPEAFVQRVLSGSPRQGASIEPPGSGAARVRVTVTPDSSGELVLSAAERRRALAPTRDYPADAARVRELLPVIIGKQTDPNKIAALVVAWVHKRIRYEITPRRVDGAKVLENGRGDCSEYATLTVTLLRAAGVPAQERSGMMASGTDMTAHAWAAYHDGKRWHEVDPTAGTASVTAGHLEMSVIDVLALDAVGGLKVIAIE